MATRTRPQRVAGDGAGRRPEAFALEPPSRRRRRLPELAVGLVVMVGFALAGVLWHLSAVAKDPALALARDLGRGEVVEASDLRVVYVASDEPIARLADTEMDAVSGRVALTDLEAGTLLTRRQVAVRPVLAEGEGVVGLALEPGQFPTGGLASGDRVNAVAADAQGAAGGEARALASGAEVFSVEELDGPGQGRLFVALKMPEEAANAVAAAAETGAVRLVLVAQR